MIPCSTEFEFQATKDPPSTPTILLPCLSPGQATRVPPLLPPCLRAAPCWLSHLRAVLCWPLATVAWGKNREGRGSEREREEEREKGKKREEKKEEQGFTYLLNQGDERRMVEFSARRRRRTEEFLEKEGRNKWGCVSFLFYYFL